MQSKYERVMSCSLNAMQHLLKSIPQPQQEALTQRCHILLGEPKFWKLAKHKNVMVMLYDSMIECLNMKNCIIIDK